MKVKPDPVVHHPWVNLLNLVSKTARDLTKFCDRGRVTSLANSIPRIAYKGLSDRPMRSTVDGMASSKLISAGYERECGSQLHQSLSLIMDNQAYMYLYKTQSN